VRSFVAVPVVCLAFCALAAAQPQSRKLFIAGSGPDELWEVTTRAEIAGMPMQMPAQTSQLCLRKDRSQKPESHVPNDDKCKTTSVQTVGNRVTFTVECSGEEPMTGRGDITSTPTSYEGKMEMKSTRRGQAMEMKQAFSGRKVGACTDQSEKVVAAAAADSQAATAKACADGLEGLYAPMFYGQGAMCGAQQQQFSDRVATIARDGAMYRATHKKVGAQVLGDAFTATRQDRAAARKLACASAVSGADWSFVGSGECDDDVRQYGPRHCGDRSRSPEPVFFPLCSRYVALTRGKPDDAAAAAAAAAQSRAPAPPATPTTEDAVKQGLDAVRKLLPF
jgi:hypothetical protein